MSLYFVTYDLRNERDYDKLHRELEAFDAAQVLESTWCFRKTHSSADKLLKHFRSFIDKDDGLLIQRTSDWSAFNTNTEPDEPRQ